jgi:hypothetical protein
MVITKNNWYEHAKLCKVCWSVEGSVGIVEGQVAVEQPSVAQAGPSVQGASANETERGVQSAAPRTPRNRPVVGRNPSRKRKALEFDGESGDEFKERMAKARTSQIAIIHGCSCLMCFTAGQAPHMISYTFRLGTVLYSYCCKGSLAAILIAYYVIHPHLSLSLANPVSFDFTPHHNSYHRTFH